MQIVANLSVDGPDLSEEVSANVNGFYKKNICCAMMLACCVETCQTLFNKMVGPADFIVLSILYTIIKLSYLLYQYIPNLYT